MALSQYKISIPISLPSKPLLTVGMLFLYELVPKKYVLYLGITTSIIYAALISISRLHYTIDVIIALYTTLFVYQNVCKYYPYYKFRCNPYTHHQHFQNITIPNPDSIINNDHETIIIQRTRARSQST